MSRGLAYRRHQVQKAKERTRRRLSQWYWSHRIKLQEALDQALIEGRNKGRHLWAFRNEFPPDALETLYPDPWWTYNRGREDVGLYTSWHGPRGSCSYRKTWGSDETLPFSDRKRAYSSRERLKDWRLCINYLEEKPKPEITDEEFHNWLNDCIEDNYWWDRDWDEYNQAYDDLHDEYEDEEWFDTVTTF
tara:strand:+ start:439 stop:1008 length:570 start_codon:yes stop_codon:yes gene_type:complete